MESPNTASDVDVQNGTSDSGTPERLVKENGRTETT
jgi:hypothetical protein